MILVILGIALAYGAYWITYARPIVFCTFLQEDSMDAAFCGTYYKLADYEEEPQEAHDWLVANHGEAPGQLVMLVLIDWARDNQEDFIELLSRIDEEHEDDFIGRLAFAISDSRQSDHFEQTFDDRKGESGRLRRILVLLKDVE